MNRVILSGEIGSDIVLKKTAKVAPAWERFATKFIGNSIIS